MSQSNKIDRLFQKKFKDFEQKAPEKVWERIEKRLDGSPDRLKTLYFSRRILGWAASIALILGLGYLWWPQSSVIPSSTISLDTDKEPNDASDVKEGSSNENTTLSSSPLKNRSSDNPSSEPIVNNTDAQATEKDLPGDDNISTTGNVTSTTLSNQVTTNSVDEMLWAKEKEISNVSNSKQKQELSEIAYQSESSKTTHEAGDEDAGSSVPKINDKQAQEALDTRIPELVKSEYPTQVTRLDRIETPASQLITEQMARAELSAEKPEDIEDISLDPQLDRWMISPQVAAVYFNTLSQGSPIHEQFKDNGKTGLVNLSYGVNVVYSINPKFQVRSGVSQVALGYETEAIAFQPQVSPQAIATIDYRQEAVNIAMQDREIAFATNSEIIGETVSVINNPNGRILQEFTYLEVPVEVKYRMTASNFGFSVIGGASSLFLTNNTLSLRGASSKYSVGEVNNLNDVSFSANIGLGLDYRLGSHFLINLDPMFKYQFNTFSREAGNFQPYILGLYTGLSFRF